MAYYKTVLHLYGFIEENMRICKKEDLHIIYDTLKHITRYCNCTR